MNFYLDSGYLDIPAIERYADRHGVNYIFIIGKRQVGKTYGVLKLMLDGEKRFMFMRRTNRELGMIVKGLNSPFEAIDGYEGRVQLKGNVDDATLAINLYDNDDMDDTKSHLIGMAIALSTVASIRGFNGRPYTDLVYDECIPESHVYKIPNEDEAFNNAYTTINGNRELKGDRALRCWLLANSNRLDCAILRALNLVDVVEKMSRNGEEYRLLKERGILIFMPESKEITEKHKQTALYRAISGENSFTKMSLNNEFSHNDFTDIERQEFNQYKLLCNLRYESDIAVMKHKSKALLYVCERYYWHDDIPFYNAYDSGKNKFKKDFPNVRSYYLRGKIKFQTADLKYQFLAYMKLI